MPKSNTNKQNKSDNVPKRKKGRPKKKTSKLNSPTKHIEKEKMKRGRPRKTPIEKKPDAMQTSIINQIHDNVYRKDSNGNMQFDDSGMYRPEQSAIHQPGSGRRLDEEALEQREMIENMWNKTNDSKVMTRRSQRLMGRDEPYNKHLSLEERMNNLEEMLSSIGMMVIALHKKTVNKPKKSRFDELIRLGFNVETARTIKKNLLNDNNYFDKVRKSSFHHTGNESMISAQGSVKQ